MIPFDFEYYRPDTLNEALDAYADAAERGLDPVWYGGGTELISMARAGSLSYGAVFDVKSIPELRVCSLADGFLTLGAALTLSDLTESGVENFPLLAKCAGRVADHTTRCKITLGGNLLSTIIYRETSLALLLADAKITVAGSGGVREYAFKKAFTKQLVFPKSELLVSVSVPAGLLNAQYFHVKKTKNEKIDYPLLTLAALVDGSGGKLRAAFSGLAAYPFRDERVEEILNARVKSRGDRAVEAVAALKHVIASDISGTGEYRAFVLRNTLENLLEEVEG